MKHSKLDKARAALIIDQPFFASILLPMPMIENNDIPTMATDGETFLYNSQWLESLTLDEVVFVLAHETLHCVFDHMGTRGNRTPNRWNQAADYVINDLLVHDKVGSMPVGGLYNPQLVKKGEGTSIGVYNLLPASDEKKKSGTKGGALDQVNDAGTNNGTTPTDAAKMAQKSADLKVRVTAARNAAKMQGKLSAGMARIVDDMLKPQVDWREALRRFVSERAKIDYSFAKPKRRFLSQDLYLPSLTGERMGKLSVAVDCSGSVDVRLLTKFSSEINAIREDLKPSSIELVYFDSRVCHTETINADDELTISAHGGGGTAFSPVIEHINSSEEIPCAVVFLTDLVCDDFGNAPEYPVIWCILGKAIKGYDKVPYGEILEVSDDE